MNITPQSFDKTLVAAYALIKRNNVNNAKENKNMKKTNRSIAFLLATVLAVGNMLLLAAPASAASLSNTYVRETRMAAAATSSVRLVFQAKTTGAGSISIAFNGADTTTWTGTSGLVNATQTVSSASCAADTGATAVPGTLAAAGATGTITITGATSMTAGTNYCVDLTSATAVTNPSAGEYHPVVTEGSDSETVAVRIISNDQIVVTAVVPPSFNFVLSGNTDTFTTNLAAGSVVSTSGVTATVNTNAKTGWIAWAKDANAGLASTVASKTIASTTAGSTATLAAGTEGYVLGITNIAQGSGAGVTSAASGYDATASGGVNNTGGGVDTNLRQIASSTGTASTAVLTLKERAAINSLTPAASDYTDTITVIGAGSF